MLQYQLYTDILGDLIIGGTKMAKSNRRELVRLVSTGGTGYFYTTSKKRGQDKLLLKKFDPKLKKHVEFKESKIK